MRFVMLYCLFAAIVGIICIVNAEPCPEEYEPLNIARYMGARIPQDLSSN